MVDILGIGAMSPQEIAFELQRGAKFVQYQYCYSLVVVTFKRGTDIYFVPAGESAVVKGMAWTLFTLLLGWWGIPWGPIFSMQSLWINLRGGRDVTPQAARVLQVPIDIAKYAGAGAGN
jgi:hypothetical protein